MREGAVAHKNPTQALVDLCLAVQAGDFSRLEQLERQLHERTSQISRGFAYFLSQVERQGSEFDRRYAPQLDAVEQGFEAYETALVRLGEFLRTRDLAQLERDTRTLQEAAASLTRSMQAYEEAFLSQGPSRFAQINLLTNLSGLVTEGKARLETWESACTGYLNLYQGILAEIDASAALSKAGIPERRAAVARILALIQELLPFPHPLEGILDRLNEALLELERALEIYHTSALAAGPTPIVQANLVLDAARNFLAGTSPGDLLVEAAKGYLLEIEKAFDEIDSATGSQESTLLEHANRVLDALEDMQDGLRVLCQDVTIEQLKGAMAGVEAAAHQLHACRAAVDAYQDTVGKIACPGCGHLAPPGTRHCAACGRKQPQIVSEWSPVARLEVLEDGLREGVAPFQITLPMKTLYEATEAFLKGKLPAVALNKLLDENFARLEEAEAHLERHWPQEPPADLEEPLRSQAEQAFELAQETCQNFQEGTTQCRDGLESMRRALTFENGETLLESGLRNFCLGIQKLLVFGQGRPD